MLKIKLILIYENKCSVLREFNVPLYLYKYIRNWWIVISYLKVKVKVTLWGFSTLCPFGLLYSYPQQVPEFISRGAAHHTDARELYQRSRELLPMNFASKSVIHENPLRSFTCRKAGTWDNSILLPLRRKAYWGFSGRPKNPTASAGFEPANSGSSGQYANH